MNYSRLAVVAGLLIGLALTGCNSTKTTSTDVKEPAKPASTERKERYRHSSVTGSMFLEKKKAPTSEADSAASRAAFEEAQRRGMRPVRDGGS